MTRYTSPDSWTVLNESLPVSDAVFARICRSTPTQAQELAMQLPPAERAQLALFCNARAHLRDVGRHIAAACGEDMLVREGGHAGRVLFGQLQAGPETWGVQSKISLKRVTLAQ